MFAGENVLIRTTIYIRDVLNDPQTCKLTITKENGTDTSTPVIADVDMEKISTGKYQYVWDSDGETEGWFYAKINVKDSGSSGNWEFKTFKLL